MAADEISETISSILGMDGLPETKKLDFCEMLSALAAENLRLRAERDHLAARVAEEDRRLAW